MSRFLRFDYLDEKHIINLDQVVSVMRWDDMELARTYVQMTNGEFEFYGEQGLAVWHALCGLVDRTLQNPRSPLYGDGVSVTGTNGRPGTVGYYTVEEEGDDVQVVRLG